jgi:hypothetical protein
MNRTKRMALVAGALGALLAACQLIVGVEQEADTPRPEKAPPVPDAATPDADPCPHARPPGPPAVANEATASTTHVFAIRKATFGGLAQYPQSFDFDNRCSCANRDTRDPSRPATSCIQATKECEPGRESDDNRGADLGGTALLAVGGDKVTEIVSGELNNGFERGDRGILVRLEGYNETADDSSVDVAIVPSGGIQRPAGGAADRPRAEVCSEVTSSAYQPKWDESKRDVWYREKASAQLTKTRGYVVGGKLVVENPNGSYKLPLFGQVVEESHPILVADLTKTASGFKLTGNLVGIVSTNRLINIIGSIRNADGGAGFCQDSIFGIVTGVICRGRDLLESGNDPTRPCDAVALAIGVETQEVTEGDATFDCPQTPPAYSCDASCPPIEADAQ